jgi:hypothetical protein
MVLTRRFEAPDLITATLAGVVTSHDQEELVTFVRALIPAVGFVRLLIRLERFGGWHHDAALGDEALWLRDDERVRKMAIVGHRAWKRGVLTMIAQPLRSIPIEYFETEAAARRWLGTVNDTPHDTQLATASRGSSHTA